MRQVEKDGLAGHRFALWREVREPAGGSQPRLVLDEAVADAVAGGQLLAAAIVQAGAVERVDVGLGLNEALLSTHSLLQRLELGVVCIGSLC